MTQRSDFTALYRGAKRTRAPRDPYSRQEVFARWGYRCGYCDSPAEHLDHITPIACGGLDVLRNVIPACAPCNYSKGTLTLAQWAQAIDSLTFQ